MEHPALTTPPYVVTLRETTPRTFTHNGVIPRAYVGVSVDNPNFTGRRLLALLQWLQAHVNDCQLVVGAELSRWTVMLERGIAEEQARVVAARHGRRQVKELRRALLQVSRPNTFILTTCAELRQHPRYLSASRELETLLNFSPLFSDLVDHTVRDYCNHRETRGRPRSVTMEQAISLSRSFITEELALFCVLVHLGYPVEVYPGPELPVLEEIAYGRIPGAPRELTMRSNLSVALAPKNGD